MLSQQSKHQKIPDNLSQISTEFPGLRCSALIQRYSQEIISGSPRIYLAEPMLQPVWYVTFLVVCCYMKCHLIRSGGKAQVFYTLWEKRMIFVHELRQI